MRFLVRSLIPEPVERFFKDTEIDQYINLGHRRFVEKTLIVDGSFGTGLIDGQSDYDLTGLPNLGIRRVAIFDSFGNKFKLRKVNPGQIDDVLPTWENSPTSTPAFYVLKHNRLMSLSPAPNFSVPNGIEVMVKKIPVDLLNATDIPVYPRVYHDAPVMYAVGLAKQKDQEFTEADRFFARFEDIAARARRDMERMNGDEPESMRTQEVIAFIGGRKI